MAEEKTKDSKLTRMTLGGVEQLPDFSGDKQDYVYINRITFRGHRKGRLIKAIGLRGSESVFFNAEPYDPTEADEFMLALNKVLENQGWYFGYVSRDETYFRDHERVSGALYSKKDTVLKPKSQ